MQEMLPFTIDWKSLLDSPLLRFIPVTVGTAHLVWFLTEAASFFTPKKWLPALALTLGPVSGWAVNRLELLDFGWGPDGWGRAVFFGLFAGALAVLGHDFVKTRWPYKILTHRTPGADAPAGGQP